MSVNRAPDTMYVVCGRRSWDMTDSAAWVGIDLRVTWVCVHDFDLAPKRLESRLSHHLMTRLDLRFSWLKSATCTVTMIIVYMPIHDYYSA